MRRLTDAQRDLAEQWWPEAMRLARQQGRRYVSLGVDPSDAAVAALWRFVRAWDGTDGGIGLLIRCVRLAWVDIIRETQGRVGTARQRRVVHPFSTIDADPGELWASDDEPVGAGEEYHDQVKALSRKLTPRQAVAFRLYYLHAAASTVEGCARALGTNCPQTASLRLTSARAVLSQMLLGATA